MRIMSQDKIERLADFINQYARDNNGASPSLSEIMEYMSMSRSTAYRYILELKKRGLVSYSGKNTLQTELQRKMRCGFKRIPIIGQIVCGSADEQEEILAVGQQRSQRRTVDAPDAAHAGHAARQHRAGGTGGYHGARALFAHGQHGLHHRGIHLFAPE